jgi:hypothetical protein
MVNFFENVTTKFHTFFLNNVFHSGDTIMLTCKISVGDEENIEIMWYNSKQSGSVGQTRKLDLSNIELSDGDQRYKADYWCFAKNSDGPGRSQNVTVYIISQGKTALLNVLLCLSIFMNY